MQGKVALVGQDYLRRTVLKEHDSLENRDIIGLVDQTVRYCLNQGYDVVLEGIFNKGKYGEMLRRLAEIDGVESHVFYLDVSFEETLRRHETKPVKDEFGGEEMKRWFTDKDYLGMAGEVVLGESLSVSESVDSILMKVRGKK